MGTRDLVWTRWWQSSGRGELAELLWRDWDPIFRGMGKSPKDEYESEAEEIGEMLRGGATPEQVAGWLHGVETRMRLHPDDDDQLIDTQVARAIVEWYTTSVPNGP